ncbi:Predicted DNA-binding transcriptional regulator YafY, contains an HTH and WYL domains [Enhydrobacter aerosaccus]|uniref:Predicted DNA-binding transcriptional regulator YafY, contains an HTH and WYL domains n=1 Tax=Enhydrobacter aerosaccus TaxID=225324 RepID=A0A1T4RJN7_9HYPH|nr:YafY family protein [Enhydrobacter aerosaccus]SKA15881.1 Predicted DNA-binding transcriptional regulator YafY, contains an HTH and WYL domains [Enhydrobacter aerosaccus]
MRRSDRLFDIIQHLRVATRPVTAAMLAADLEVTVRTVYRDIATLQARRVPIDGEAGVGYVLRKSFNLPPLMFTADEAESIAVGARLVQRLRDPKLQEAAASVLAKVTTVLPEALRSTLGAPHIFVSEGSAVPAEGVDLAELRAAIRDSRKLHIAYADEKGRRTNRTIWPIAMAYYVDVTLVGAWCELRADYRNFRVERILSSRVLDEHFDQDNGRLFAEWSALPKERPDSAWQRR